MAKAPAAMSRSLRDKIKLVAKGSAKSASQIEREFIIQRFLARIFLDQDASWILKGGTGMLVRLPTARHTRDLDLMLREGNLDSALNNLREICGPSNHDPFVFNIVTVGKLEEPFHSVQLKVEALLGVTAFSRFPIDLSMRDDPPGVPEVWQLCPIISAPELGPLPPVKLYSLPDQIADKVAAMWETHGMKDQPSTRYRDLVDLVLIMTNFNVGSVEAWRAISREVKRRGVSIPERIESPGPGWKGNYSSVAKEAGLPINYQELEPALDLLAVFLGCQAQLDYKNSIWDPTYLEWCP